MKNPRSIILLSEELNSYILVSQNCEVRKLITVKIKSYDRNIKFGQEHNEQSGDC